MNKKGQSFVAALGGAGGVIVLVILIVLIVGSQNTNVRELKVSIGSNNQLLSLNYTLVSVSKFTVWFNSQPSGFYNIKIYDTYPSQNSQAPLLEYSNIGGFDFSFYLTNPSLSDCIYIRLGAEPSDSQLGQIEKVCLNEPWNQ